MADPLARALFSQLRQLPELDRLQVIAAIRARLRPAEADSRAHWVAEAFTAFSDSGVPLSESSFTAWRTRQEDPKQWPTVKQVRTVFGSWSKALDELGGVVTGVDVAASRLAARGVRVTGPELVAAVQAWREACPGDPHTHTAYLTWLIAVRGTGEAPPVPLPRHMTCFQREFGSFTACLDAAGIPRLTDEKALTRVHLSRCDHVYFDDASMVESVKACARELRCPPTAVAYHEWALSREDCPSMLQVRTRFLGWAYALAACELISEHAAALTVETARPFTEAECLTGARTVMATTGHRHVRRAVYVLTRARLVEAWVEEEGPWPPPRLPSAGVLERRLGRPWSAVLQRVADFNAMEGTA